MRLSAKASVKVRVGLGWFGVTGYGEGKGESEGKSQGKGEVCVSTCLKSGLNHIIRPTKLKLKIKKKHTHSRALSYLY